MTGHDFQVPGDEGYALGVRSDAKSEVHALAGQMNSRQPTGGHGDVEKITRISDREPAGGAAELNWVFKNSALQVIGDDSVSAAAQGRKNAFSRRIKRDVLGRTTEDAYPFRGTCPTDNGQNGITVVARVRIEIIGRRRSLVDRE